MLFRSFVALVRLRCELSVRVRVGVFLSEHHLPSGQTVRVFSTAGQTSRVSLTARPTARVSSTAGQTATVADQEARVSSEDQEVRAPSTAGQTVRVTVSSTADPAARVAGKKARISLKDHEGPDIRVPSIVGQKATVRISSSAGHTGRASSTKGETARVLPDDRECNLARVPSTAGQTGRLSSKSREGKAARDPSTTGRLTSKSREGKAARVPSTAGQTSRVPAGTAGGQISKLPQGMSGAQISRVEAATAGQALRISSVEGPIVRVSPPEAQLYGNAAEDIPASQAGVQAPEALQSIRKSRASLKEKQSISDAAEMGLKVQLLNASGMASSDLNTLLKKRAFFSAPLEKLEAVVTIFTKFFGADVACKVLAHNSGTLIQPVKCIEQKLKCLEDFQVGEKACKRIGTTKHYILTMPPDSLQNKLSYLQSIGLTVKSRNLLLCRFPQVLRLSIETSMQPTIVYLENKGMARHDIMKLISEHPAILAMSVDNNLVKKFELLGQLGLSREECHKAIGFVTLPSCQRVLLQVEALKSFGLSGEDVLEMFRRKPELLIRSQDNLNKKLDLFVNVEYRDIKEIVRYPACLCFNLERRIIPRINALREIGKLSSYSLASILSTTEVRFRRQFFPSSEQTSQLQR